MLVQFLLGSLANVQKLVQLFFVKADDHVVADSDHGHAHLAGHLYHLLPLLKVRGNVIVGKLDIVFCKMVLGQCAEVAGRR